MVRANVGRNAAEVKVESSRKGIEDNLSNALEVFRATLVLIKRKTNRESRANVNLSFALHINVQRKAMEMPS